MTGGITKTMISDEIWALYAAEVAALAVQGMERYVSRDGVIEPVYQISIWTDVGAAVSAINFETKEHARESVKRSAQWWLERGNVEEARRISEEPDNGNPEDFKYKRFGETSHPALMRALEAIELTNATERILETELAIWLLEVVSDLIVSPQFARLPKEPTVYIGVSSPDDWYDHVQAWTAD